MEFRKTQLAVAYALQFKDKNPNSYWILWVNAASKETIEGSYRRIAEALEIPNLDKPGCNCRYQVSSRLESVVEVKWLLIYDNLNDETVLERNQGPDPYSDYLPSRQNGSVLITTQDKGVALSVTESIELITVGKMSDEHVQNMFERNRVDADMHQVKKLSEAVEGVPLAIQQAINYIMSEREEGETYSIESYLRDLCEKKDILSKNEGPGNSVVATLDLSYRSIRDKNPSAADLLLLMSCFERQGIPEEALSQSGDAYKNRGNDDFHSHARMLIRCSFISVEENKSFIYNRYGKYKCYEMHSLVHQEAEVWRKSDSQSEGFVAQFITNIWAPISLLDWTYAEVRTRFFTILPHLSASLELYPLHSSLLRNRYMYAYTGAYFAYVRGRFAESVAYHEAVVCDCKALRTKRYRIDTCCLTESLYVLGRMHYNADLFEQSEQYLRQGIEESKLLGGRGNKSLLMCISSLAYVLVQTNKRVEAQRICKEMIREYEDCPGHYQSSKLTMINAGRMYAFVGEYEKARKIYEEEKVKYIGGSSDAYDLCIARTYHIAQDWNKAEVLYKNLLERSTETHPNSVYIVESLIRALSKLNKHDEASHWRTQLERLRESAGSGRDRKNANQIYEALKKNYTEDDGPGKSHIQKSSRIRFWFSITIILCYFIIFSGFGIIRYPRMI